MFPQLRPCPSNYIADEAERKNKNTSKKNPVAKKKKKVSGRLLEDIACHACVGVETFFFFERRRM